MEDKYYFFSSIIGVPLGIVSAIFSLVFYLTTVVVKKLLKITRNKKEKHNKIFMLAKSKLNSIETLIFRAFIDLEISPEEFKTIINEEEKYRRLKEKIRMIKSRDELSEKQ